MKLAVSNIAWAANYDEEMYSYLREYGFYGLEIAPTRIFPEAPYQHCQEAEKFAKRLRKDFDLTVCSIQSIWYGRQEKLFGTETERQLLLSYTKQAIDFASAMQCKNVVFGCPRNRVIENSAQYEIAVQFFQDIGSYAKEKGTIVAIEPNPEIYHTNFINTTLEGLNFCRDVCSDGIAVNLDCGTIIQNMETPDCIANDIHLINHVHLSEPNLAKIEHHNLHRLLRDLLIAGKYNNFVSIEMKRYDDIEVLKKVMAEVTKEFCNDL
jgi:sugar phosphate isomerase/epimerase